MLISTLLTAGVLAAGCRQDEVSALNYFEVRLEADASSPQACRETVAIEFSPVSVEAQPAGSRYQSATYTEHSIIVGKPVEDGAGNWECWFTYRSRDLAPGRWRIDGAFATGPKSCEREIYPGRLGHVRIDQEEGCVEFDRPGTEVDDRNVRYEAAPGG